MNEPQASPSGPGDGQLLIFQDGSLNLQVRLDGQTVWLTQAQLAELYQTSKQNVSLHIQNILDDNELRSESVVKEYLTTAADGKGYRTLHYSLDMILAVGYRVRSPRGTLFRQWATTRLSELLVKGFTLDDERIKAGRTIGADYFDELLARIRDIRASERLFYLKITDIYATSIDYDANAELTQLFFQTVQNKMHWAAHGHTAAEIVRQRADAALPNMGLSTWKNAPAGPVRKQDAAIAKNYLSQVAAADAHGRLDRQTRRLFATQRARRAGTRRPRVTPTGRRTRPCPVRTVPAATKPGRCHQSQRLRRSRQASNRTPASPEAAKKEEEGRRSARWGGGMNDDRSQRPPFLAVRRGMTFRSALLAMLAIAAPALADPPRMDIHGDPLPEGALARFGTVRFRTGTQPYYMYSELSADGTTLVTATEPGVAVWDVETGRLRAHFRVPVVPMDTTALRVSPDGKLLVCNTETGVHVYDTVTGSLRSKLKLERNGFAAGFYPGTTRLAVVCEPGNSVIDCDVADGRKLSTQTTKENVFELLPSGRFFRGQDGKTPYLVDAKTGKLRCRFPDVGHGQYANFAVTADGQKLCETDRSGRLRVYSADTGELLEDLVPPWKDPEGLYGEVSVSPDGTVAYVAVSDQETHRRDLKNGKWLRPLPEMPYGRLIPHPDGKRVLLLDQNGLLRRYDLATLKEIPPADGFDGSVKAEASPDGRRVAVAATGSTGRRVRVFDLTGRVLWSEQQFPCWSFAWSLDGKHLARVGSDGVTIHDAATGKPGAVLHLPADTQPLDARFTPDGKRLFVSFQDQGLAEFDLATGKQTGLNRVFDRARFEIAPDGRVLFSDQGLGTSVFDPAAGRFTADWTGDEGVPNNYDPSRARFSPDGSCVLSWDYEENTFVRDPATLHVVRKFRVRGAGAKFHTAISPNGLWLAVGSDDSRLSLWDISSGRRLGQWDGHLAAITGVSFAGPGRVVTDSADLTALLWELRPKGKVVLPIWHALAGTWSIDAYRAVWALADDPNGPDLLRGKIAPAAATPPEKMKQWLIDLDSDRFTVREAAMKELQSLGRLVEPELKAARTQTKSAEVRSRLDGLLAKILPARSHSDIVQARAVAAMELAGTAAAKKLLAEWAAGAPGARLTIDAKAALGRLVVKP